MYDIPCIMRLLLIRSSLRLRMLEMMGKRSGVTTGQLPGQQQQQQQQHPEHQHQPSFSLKDLSSSPSVEEPFSGITDLSPDQVRRKQEEEKYESAGSLRRPPLSSNRKDPSSPFWDRASLPVICTWPPPQPVPSTRREGPSAFLFRRVPKVLGKKTKGVTKLSPLLLHLSKEKRNLAPAFSSSFPRTELDFPLL